MVVAVDQEQRCISRLSEKMMQGWTLLSQHCPRCTTVLVGHKTHGVECVSCEMPCVTEEQAEQMKVLSTANGHVADVPGKDVADMDDYDEEDGGWTPPSPEEMRRIEALSAERDRISQRMGPKLLSGWIMLNAHCRSCATATPLLQSPDRRMFCAGCDRFMDEDTPAQVESGERVEVNIPTPATDDRQILDEVVVSLPKVESTTLRSGQTGSDCSLVARTVEGVLVRKLEQLRDRLDDEDHPSGIVDLSKAISAAAQALKELSGI
ncbi:Sjoegren syndrome/scleroderma autoantigen 1 [Plasmodiophora brassicae]|uniref:Sjoegren syndrome/scleroderma autoantigen 1 n=1 Tax=Plasmodiophora brassicae TaxID=37360 RepID=A0A3P3YIV0_PLABS|nr:unnamed protein product [Plasmodiophora brassicae]